MVSSKKTSRKTRHYTTDALAILHDRYVKNDPEMARMVEVERANLDIARDIHDLRTAAGLSQRALAKRVGTTASVICRLEDSDYEGHSLTMLSRIAAALDRRVEIRFVATRSAKAKTATATRGRTPRVKRRAS